MPRGPRADRPRLRLLPTVLLTLAILALPTVVYAWGRSSSSFDITGIEVSGTDLVRKKQALKLLRRDYAGRNLFTVTGDDVHKTLGALCFVAGVSVDRDFPETLTVIIEEYEPAAYALAGSRWYVVDVDGYVICTASKAAEQLAAAKKGDGDGKDDDKSGDASSSPSAATSSGGDQSDGESAEAGGEEDGSAGQSLTQRLVAGPAQKPLPLPRIAVAGKVRERTRLDDSGTAAMLHVIAALPRSFRRRLDSVENNDGRLTLRFAGGLVTKWGDAERTLAKTVALRTVLKEYEKRGKTCTSLDVSIPDRTLAKPVLD